MQCKTHLEKHRKAISGYIKARNIEPPCLHAMLYYVSNNKDPDPCFRSFDRACMQEVVTQRAETNVEGSLCAMLQVKCAAESKSFGSGAVGKM